MVEEKVLEENVSTENEAKEFALENYLVLFSRHWANEPDSVIEKLYKEIEFSFVNMIKSYLLEKNKDYFYQIKDLPEEQLDGEFLKRYKNFYITLEKVKEKISNLSEEDINVIREKTTDFYNGQIDHFKYNNDSQTVEARKKWNNNIEKMKIASDEEMKQLLNFTMPFEWIELNFPYPIDGVIDKDSEITETDKKIDELFDELCKDYRFKEISSEKDDNYNRGLMFEYYDSSISHPSMSLSQSYNGDLYPGLSMCKDMFEKIENKKNKNTSRMGL